MVCALLYNYNCTLQSAQYVAVREFCIKDNQELPGTVGVVCSCVLCCVITQLHGAQNVAVV